MLCSFVPVTIFCEIRTALPNVMSCCDSRSPMAMGRRPSGVWPHCVAQPKMRCNPGMSQCGFDDLGDQSGISDSNCNMEQYENKFTKTSLIPKPAMFRRRGQEM